jgi:hypothetical protein
MVGPSKSRPPMSHRKTDLGILRPLKSAKVVLRRPDNSNRIVTVGRRQQSAARDIFAASSLENPCK